MLHAVKLSFELVLFLSPPTHATVLSVVLKRFHPDQTPKHAILLIGKALIPMAEKDKKPTSSSFFTSPKLFNNFSFTSKMLSSETSTDQAMLSPTSILDTKLFSFSSFKNPFWSESNSSKSTTVGENKPYYWDSKGLVDALVDDKPSDMTSQSQSRMILFGSKFKIQIPRVFYGCLSASEMELSEDYTRVISHGPNPKTTHIFANCILETDVGNNGCSSVAMENVSVPTNHRIRYPSESFLSFCFYCNKSLGQDIDIYMYRERAFCSRECRYHGMLIEEGMNKLEA